MKNNACQRHISCTHSRWIACYLTNDDAFVVGGSEDGFIFLWEYMLLQARFRAHSLAGKDKP